uniref:Neur_chan_LBD domain-containing protein n=2 Tax=Macrostomum lignano TaxID=282301 RepID=A0A1I8IAI2_9PLAT
HYASSSFAQATSILSCQWLFRIRLLIKGLEDYSVNIYLRQQWYDPRLRFNRSEGLDTKDCVKLEDKIWEKLWVPDVFFRNEKKADFHHVTIPNRFINLYPDGKLWYVMKISATLSCMMQLQKYPLDTQICPMMLESFGHTMHTVVFKWLPNKSVEATDDLSMPQFILKGYPTKECSKNYTTGSYPCLQVDFILQRDIGYFIIQVYIPTVLIVILSWVAFWINTEAIPARVSLGLLTVLTMTTQSSGAGQSLPRVSYIKAIDVWMSVCLVFVFASLLEFAVVNVYSRRDIGPKKASTRTRSGSVPRRSFTSTSATLIESGGPTDQEGSPSVCLSPGNELFPLQQINNTARKIDKISRRLFPLSFIIFNVVYWVMYGVVK